MGIKFSTGFLLFVSLLFLGACSQSPQRLVDTGNRYHDKKKYQEASILYRKAIAKDKRYAEAYYREGLNLLDEKSSIEAAKFLRRAVDLNPKNVDAEIKLSEIYLTAYAYDQKKFRNLLPEIREMTAKVLARNPDDFHGIRLQAFLYLTDRDLPKALASFQLANKLQPHSREVVGWLAQVLTANNQFEDAEKLARDMIAYDKTWGPGYDFLFMQYVQRKRNADAEAILKERVSGDPKSETALVNYANYLLQTGRYPEAESEIRKGIADRSAFPKGDQLLGDFFMRAGKFDQAERAYLTGMTADPKEKLSYQLHLIGALEREGTTNPQKRSEAMELAKKVAAENPTDASASEMYATLLLESGIKQDIQKSISELRTLVQKNNTDPILHFDLARAYYGQNLLERALREALEAVRLRPSLKAPRVLTARIYEDEGQHGKALEQTAIVLDRAPNDAQAKLVRARALMGLRENDKAQPELEALVKQNPGFSDAVYQLATLYLTQKKFEDAREQFTKLWEGTETKGQPDLRGFIGLQEVKLRQGHPQEAVRSLQDLVQKNPTQATLRFTLANFEAEAASPLESGSEEKQALLADAEENYKKLVDSPGMSTEVLMRLGTVQRMLKRNNEALASFERAAKASPGNAEASLNEAMVLESLGQQEQARKVYTQTLGIDPGSVVALNNLAYLNADANRDLDQAMTYAERAKKRVPNNPNISDTLGYVYYRKNLTEEAIRELETAVNGDPKNANYRLHLAMALLKRGDKAGAKREAENALRTANTDQQDKIRSFMSQIG